MFLKEHAIQQRTGHHKLCTNEVAIPRDICLREPKRLRGGSLSCRLVNIVATPVWTVPVGCTASVELAILGELPREFCLDLGGLSVMSMACVDRVIEAGPQATPAAGQQDEEDY